MADTADDPSKVAAREKANINDPRQIELFKEFLKVQAEEIEVKRQSIQIERDNNKAQHEIAKLTIEAQRKDREDQRVHATTNGKRTYFFIVAVLVLVLIFFSLRALHRQGGHRERNRPDHHCHSRRSFRRIYPVLQEARRGKQ